MIGNQKGASTRLNLKTPHTGVPSPKLCTAHSYFVGEASRASIYHISARYPDKCLRDVVGGARGGKLEMVDGNLTTGLRTYRIGDGTAARQIAIDILEERPRSLF